MVNNKFQILHNLFVVGQGLSLNIIETYAE